VRPVRPFFVNVSAARGLASTRCWMPSCCRLKSRGCGSLDGLASASSFEVECRKGPRRPCNGAGQEGHLRIKDPILAGSEFGVVRAMFDETGAAVQGSAPSMPVVVWIGQPPNAVTIFSWSRASARRVRLLCTVRASSAMVKLARQAPRSEECVLADGRREGRSRLSSSSRQMCRQR